MLRVTLEFSGGAELLFGNVRKHAVELEQTDPKLNIRQLLVWIKDNLLQDRPELFVQGETVRPGILVLVNDADWMLLGETDYEIENAPQQSEMDLPKPPEDNELKNIIDKLANFVARNGFEFEKMTKEKQKNNPKFAFLFGGQFYSYYQFRLSTEQQINNQQKSKMTMQQGGPQDQVEQSLQSAPWQQQQTQKNFGGFASQNYPAPVPMQPNVPPPQIMPPWQQRQQAPWQQPQQTGHPPNVGPGTGAGPTPLMMAHAEPTGLVKMESDLEKEEADVEKQIQDSENNLLQHRQVLMSQQEKQITSAVESAQDEFRKNSARDVGISLESFNQVLQPIIDSCTKDSIASGKTWILANSSTQAHCSVIVNELLWKVTEALKKDQSFTTQLHIIYLINDVLHHASRKNLTLLSEAIESVIVPIFATTQTNASEDHQERLTKLLGLWNRFKYFSDKTMEELSEPAAAMNNYKEEVRIRYSHVIDKVKESIESQYKQYEKQHEEYARHIKGQVEEKRRKFEEQKSMQNAAAHSTRYEDENQQFSQNEQPSYQDDSQQHMGSQPPWSRRDGFMKNDGPGMQYDYESNRNNYDQPMHSQQRGFHRGGPPRSDWQQQPQEGPQGHFGDNQPRGQWGPNRGGPPPRDNQMMGMPPDESALIPKAPYFDLPAGLMAPLVKLEETDYKELDPALIRLPAPVPPSERLLAAVEAFYSPPSHDRPRNPDGWEQNGLFEFFRAKMRAKRRIQDMERRGNRRSPSRSPSRSPKRRSYSRSRSRSYSRSRSRSSSSSRSRSSRSRSRSKSQSPDRAPTPPSFSSSGCFAHGGGPPPDNRIQDDNRGAQMMRRMGWGGAGLGSSEQGRQDPVQAGDARDKYDQFKGLGMDMGDPYENFRKNRSQGYVSRIRGNME